MLRLTNVYNKIRDYLLVGSVVALVAASVGWYVTDLRLDHTKSLVQLEKQGRQLDRAIYEKAQVDAANKSLEAVLKKEREDVEKAKQADEAYASLLNKYNASLLRYQASQRKANTIDMSSTSITSDGSNLTSESTSISITITDAQICAENTARLQAVKTWTDSLK